MSQLTTGNRKASLTEQFPAIALILETEIGAPVQLFDAETGEELVEAPALLRKHAEPLSIDAIRNFATRKRPYVASQSEDAYAIVLPIKELGITRIVGYVRLPKIATTEEGVKREIPRLESWCHLLLEKLTSTYERGKGQGDGRHREGQMRAVLSAFDVLLGNARLHADSARFQRYALKAVGEVVGVDAAIWYGGDSNPVMVSRAGIELSAWDCRQLAATLAARTDWDRAGLLIDHHADQTLGTSKIRTLKSLLAVKVPLDGLQGMLIVINKSAHSSTPAEATAGEERPSAQLLREQFVRGDAAILASFVTLIAAQAKTSRRHQNLKDLIVGLTRSLTAAIDAKDSYTAGHSERVARSAVELGKELGLPEEQLNDIYLAGLLHDIGKIGIRDDVLGKNGKLTDEEREHINQHVVIGHRILKGLTAIEHLLGGVLHHHEQYDGRGYPHQLQGNAIPPLARILAVADSFDAMTSDRPYRRGMSAEKVEQIFREGNGTQWDPVVVDAFFRCKERLYSIRQRGIGESLREALDGAMRQDGPQEDVSLMFAPRQPASMRNSV